MIWTFIYVLIALGFSLLFGVAGILNLAHGMLAITAVYVCYWFYSTVHLSLWLSALIGIICAVISGLIIYYSVMRRFLGNESVLLLITAGCAFAIEAIVILTIGPTNRSFPTFFKGTRMLLGVPITNHQLFIVVLGIIVLPLLYVLMTRTKFGMAVQSVCQDREVASIHGVDIARTSTYVVVLSVVLAAIGGLILIPMQSAVPTKGWSIMVSAFTVTLLGGIGDLRGVLVAAAIVAYAELLTAFMIAPMMKEVATFGLMILTLLLRPRGLFGK